jgi:hypothetical protein
MAESEQREFNPMIWKNHRVIFLFNLISISYGNIHKFLL